MFKDTSVGLGVVRAVRGRVGLPLLTRLLLAPFQIVPQAGRQPFFTAGRFCGGGR